ncbi:hypothetical protein ASG36_20470 [Geodermatophilus sp. Leaf369]|uniref:DUF1015 family protein n=1 Tax=Geodermatophilus sp. Leaf369 TaxID=1736354 RepID=UPI0006F7FFA9|nr:DUF1015 domain-containing protein [Geodermatophilus sp. Leaf369]KQS54811.1 hypothetical protein ASG36_20470 [Geodermatophilus sp. Leaf369]
MAPSPADDKPPAATDTLEVRPFRATTYAVHDPDHLARVSSPAYDLVSAEGRARLAAADPHNVVRLILPELDGPPPASRAARDQLSATQAALTWTRWREEGVLVDEAAPAFWLYRMSGPGDEVTTGWLGAVTLPPPGSAAVLPHEDVWPPAVEGRRLLLDATRTDLEPIVLSHDRDADVAAVTEQLGRGTADATVADVDGVTHELWRVTDPAALDRLSAGFARTGAYIADGHHRFAAARAHAATGAAGSGAVLALLTPTGWGGLRVRAIHRVVPDLDLDTAAELARSGFTVTPVSTSTPEATARAWVDRPECGCFLLTDGTRLLQVGDPSAEVRARVPGEAPAAWRSLDVVLAHHGLVRGAWGRDPADPRSVLIAHDVDEALTRARDTSGVAVLLRSPSPGDVAAVARAGARMPRKSTLFVPKPRTGLVFRPHRGAPD